MCQIFLSVPFVNRILIGTSKSDNYQICQAGTSWEAQEPSSSFLEHSSYVSVMTFQMVLSPHNPSTCHLHRLWGESCVICAYLFLYIFELWSLPLHFMHPAMLQKSFVLFFFLTHFQFVLKKIKKARRKSSRKSI